MIGQLAAPAERLLVRLRAPREDDPVKKAARQLRFRLGKVEQCPAGSPAGGQFTGPSASNCEGEGGAGGGLDPHETPDPHEAERANSFLVRGLASPDPTNATTKERGKAKAEIVRKLKGIKNKQYEKGGEERAGFKALATEYGSKYAKYGEGTSSAMFQGLLDEWASSSGDSHPRALALQMAAQKEFGLTDAIEPEHWGAVEEAKQLLGTHETAMRQASRLVYNHTQAELKREGITHVTLYRGMGRRGLTVEPGAKGEIQHGEVKLQPLSSFSSSARVAANFSGSGEGSRLIAVRVPREAIFSTSRTGPGCLSEAEYIVMGKKMSGATLLIDKDKDRWTQADDFVAKLKAPKVKSVVPIKVLQAVQAAMRVVAAESEPIPPRRPTFSPDEEEQDADWIKQGQKPDQMDDLLTEEELEELYADEQDEPEEDDKDETTKAWARRRCHTGRFSAWLVRDAVTDGAMVCLRPTPEVAKGLAVEGGEPAESLHVTLAFCGPAADLSDAQRAGMRAVVDGVVHEHGPVEGEISGVGVFDAEDEEVLYASVDAPALPALRQRLVEGLEAAQVPVDKTHGFSPHITLRYTPKGETPPAIPRIPAQPVTFPAIHVVNGDNRAEVAYVFPTAPSVGKATLTTGDVPAMPATQGCLPGHPECPDASGKTPWSTPLAKAWADEFHEVLPLTGQRQPYALQVHFKGLTQLEAFTPAAQLGQKPAVQGAWVLRLGMAEPRAHFGLTLHVDKGVEAWPAVAPGEPRGLARGRWLERGYGNATVRVGETLDRFATVELGEYELIAGLADEVELAFHGQILKGRYVWRTAGDGWEFAALGDDVAALPMRDELTVFQAAVAKAQTRAVWPVDPVHPERGHQVVELAKALEDLVKVRVVKAEPAQRYTLGVVYPQKALDAHKDWMTAEDIEQAAWNYARKGMKVGLGHRQGTAGAGEVVESYIYRGPPWDMDGQTVHPGDWLLGTVWNEPAWQAIQRGELTGYSLQGWAAMVKAAVARHTADKNL